MSGLDRDYPFQDITDYPKDKPIAIDPSQCSFRIIEGNYESAEDCKSKMTPEELHSLPIYHLAQAYIAEDKAQQAHPDSPVGDLMNDCKDNITVVKHANEVLCGFKANDVFIPRQEDDYSLTLNDIEAGKAESQNNKAKYTIYS